MTSMIGQSAASPAAPAATKMLRAASGPYADELRPSSPSAGTPSATPISREWPSRLVSGRPLRKRARTPSGDRTREFLPFDSMGRDPFQQFPDRTSPAVDYRGKTTKCEPTAAAAIVVAFLLSNGAVQD